MNVLTDAFAAQAVSGNATAAKTDASKKEPAKKEPAKKEEEKKPLVDPETVEKHFKICRQVGEECQTEADLRNLLAKKPNFIAYDGFEPSGRMHIAQGVFKMLNVSPALAIQQ